MRTSLIFATVLTASLLLSVPAGAQTVRDAVKDHVDKNLDGKNKGKRNRRKRNRVDRRNGRTSPRRSTRTSRGGYDDSTGSGSADTISLDLDDPELLNPGGPVLPRRLFPNVARYFALDFKFDGAYRGWLPQQYDSAEVSIASYATWSVGVKGRFFRHLALHRAYYESNGLSAPRNTDAAIAAQVGKHTPKAAKALAYLGFPFWKAWQPIVRYETRAFNTKATPKIPLCVVDRNESGDLMDCPLEMNALEVISSFETFVAGVRWAPQIENRSFLATKRGKLPPMYFGIGLMQYRKPYQVNVDGVTLEEFLFDGRFRGAGLAFGAKLGGGARRFFADVDMQVGLGEVSLTEDLTLNEVTPDDWLIGYVQGNLSGGYRLVVVEGPPTIYFTPTLTAGGASFHFVRTSAEAGMDNNAPNLNWDLLWAVRAALEIAL